MPVKNTVIVILGASGDLARRKLIPALCVLYKKGEVDNSIRIVGTGRGDLTDEEFRKRFDIEGEFRNLLSYHTGIDGLKAYIDSLGSFDRYIFFFALPPSVYAQTAADLWAWNSTRPAIMAG